MTEGTITPEQANERIEEAINLTAYGQAYLAVQMIDSGASLEELRVVFQGGVEDGAASIDPHAKAQVDTFTEMLVASGGAV